MKCGFFDIFRKAFHQKLLFGRSFMSSGRENRIRIENSLISDLSRGPQLIREAIFEAVFVFLIFGDVVKMTDFFDQVRDRLTPIPCVPTGSGDFPSNSNRKMIAKAAGMVFQIYEEPRKSEFTDLELPNTKKKVGG